MYTRENCRAHTNCSLTTSLGTAHQAQMHSENIPDPLPFLVILPLEVRKRVGAGVHRSRRRVGHGLAALDEKVVQQAAGDHDVRQRLLALALPALLQQLPPRAHAAERAPHQPRPLRVHVVEDALLGRAVRRAGVPVGRDEPGEQRAAGGRQEVARHGAADELAVGRVGEHERLRGVELGPRQDLRRRLGRVPADGDVEEAALGVDQRLRGDRGGPEARVAERAAAVGEGERAEARDGAGDAVGRGEVEQGGEAVSDGAADLVEGLRRGGGRREAEAARHGAGRRGVREAVERGAELVVGRQREGGGGGGGAGGVGEREGAEERVEGRAGHAECVAPGGVRERGGGGDEAEEPGGGQRGRGGRRGERERGERDGLEVEREQGEEPRHGPRRGEQQRVERQRLGGAEEQVLVRREAQRQGHRRGQLRQQRRQLRRRRTRTRRRPGRQAGTLAARGGGGGDHRSSAGWGLGEARGRRGEPLVFCGRGRWGGVRLLAMATCERAELSPERCGSLESSLE
uniref:Uncharacterized protein n=1 Tax=Triticum urartu TaxID=4572 RepID=A0A8R7TNQ4_TRIUA